MREESTASRGAIIDAVSDARSVIGVLAAMLGECRMLQMDEEDCTGLILILGLCLDRLRTAERALGAN